MAWATGIEANDGKLVAKIAIGKQVVIRDLHSLADHGIPNPGKLQRKPLLTTNFSDWNIVDPGHYAAAFGLDPVLLRESQQSIYEFQVRDTKFQVPALVLMRAIFHPAKYILAAMFKPQALDALGFLDEEDVRIDTLRTKGGYKWVSDSVSCSLRWMFSFPTAHKMAHSVHENALSGVIGLTLPKATVRVTVIGPKQGNTYYATELNIGRIIALEEVFGHLPNFPALIFETAKPSAKPADLTIPVGAEGVEVSDKEWTEVEPVLLSKTRHQCRLAQRHLFDAILRKLSTGTPWRKLEYKVGNYIHASQAYRVWKQNDTLTAALSVLRELRQDI